MKDFVPSIGSTTQRNSEPASGLSPKVIPASSPKTACEGTRAASTSRTAASAARSATVTGDASDLESTAREGERKWRRVTWAAASAQAAATSASWARSEAERVEEEEEAEEAAAAAVATEGRRRGEGGMIEADRGRETPTRMLPAGLFKYPNSDLRAWRR